MPDRARRRLPEMPGVQSLTIERRHRRLQARQRSTKAAECGHAEGRQAMKLVQSLLIGLFAVCSAATAQDSLTRASQGLSNASEGSLAASGFVVAGSAELIATSAQLRVMAVQGVGE